MAVVGFAAEAQNSPEASFELGKHVITRYFLVQTNDYADGVLTVSSAIGLPRLFQIYTFGSEIHPYCRCRSIDPQRVEPNSLWWRVTCRYETPDPKEASGGDGYGSAGGSDGGGTGVETDQQFQNPLVEIPEVSTHFETKQEPIYGIQGLGQTCSVSNGSATVTFPGTTFFQVGDPVIVTYGSKLLSSTVNTIAAGTSVTLANNWTGATTAKAVIADMRLAPCQSSALETFIPPPMMDVSRMVLTITRNEDINSPHPALALAYMDTVNSDVFWGANPGQVKVQSITSQRQVKQLPDGTIYPFLKVTYIFHFKPTWDIQLLDKGTYYLYQKTMMDPVRKQKFLTDDGQPREGLLDGKGGKLADGGNPVFLTVRPYNWLPFGALNLPQNYLSVS